MRFLKSHVGSPRFGKQFESKNAACSPEPKSPIKHDRFQTQLRPSPPASPVLNKWRSEKAPTSTPTAVNREPEFTVTEKVLGEGAFSQVKLATNNSTGQKVAVKSFSLPTAGAAAMNSVQKENFTMLKKERDILAKMPAHVNVVKMHHSTEDLNGMNLYLQFVEGGDAYTWLCERGRVAVSASSSLLFTALLTSLFPSIGERCQASFQADGPSNRSLSRSCWSLSSGRQAGELPFGSHSYAPSSHRFRLRFYHYH
jgi:hypothetical protein